MLLPFDELDNLINEWKAPFQPIYDRGKVIDDIYEMLVLAYVYGFTGAADNLGVKMEIDPRDAERTIYAPVAEKSWVERVNEAFDNAVETDGGQYAPSGDVIMPLIEIIIRIVSVSLVYRLIISPWRWRSV